MEVEVDLQAEVLVEPAAVEQVVDVMVQVELMEQQTLVVAVEEAKGLVL